MALLLFFIILSALVIVHELGHFGAAKSFGIRVDEFGLGYPPRAARLFSWKNTLFSLNWLPFGGFVKIFGENYEEGSDLSHDSFQAKNRGAQAVVLSAGVLGNFIFAWVLLSLGFMVGLPAPMDSDLPVTNPRVVITEVLPDSPAYHAGLKSGDTILSLQRESNRAPLGQNESSTPENFSQFITGSSEPIEFEIKRGGAVLVKTVVPAPGMESGKPMVGIAMDNIGMVKLPPHWALGEGFSTTLDLTAMTAKGLLKFLWQAVTAKADLSTVTGPVGLVGLVGDANALGWGHLLSFTALISINLCLINLLPFPALDGGRLLFVGIESITRKKIPSGFFSLLNLAGFALLILLMIFITVNDVGNLF